VISELDFIVERIKKEEPDLPQLIIESHRNSGGDLYLQSFAFD
jgi:hypothetical protein